MKTGTHKTEDTVHVIRNEAMPLQQATKTYH